MNAGTFAFIQLIDGEIVFISAITFINLNKRFIIKIDGNAKILIYMKNTKRSAQFDFFNHLERNDKFNFS